VILPTVSEVGGRVRVSAEVIDPHTQTTVYAESADGTGAASTLHSIDTVTAALRGKLGEALQSIEKDSEPLPRVATSNLDALRAYALGQEAFGLGHYEDAKGFYASAAKMDPQFALAYVGSLRAHNALDDLAGGLPFLKNAQALREHLPPRDQLYLDAWTAEVRSPPEALDKWRRMLALYPDFFPAAANVGYAFYSRNRYADGLPYARRATAPQNAFAPLSWDLVGRLSLGLQRYKDAEHAFGIAATRGSTGARIRLANAIAAQKQFSAAGRTWAQVPSADALGFDRIAFYLDQGQLPLARAQAQAFASSIHPQSRLGRAAAYPMAVVAWAGGDVQGALQQLRHVSEEALASSEQAVNASDATDDAYLAIAAAIFAQRMGDTELANMVAKRLQQLAPSKAPQVSALLGVLEANNLRLTHKSDLAIARLESITDGSEPVQAHVALLDAYAASGQTEKALIQARWLTSHRGAAYAENGCGWCQQPLNVFDTTLAHLRAGELLASLHRGSEAKLELQAFDRQWPTQRLPDYLRLRRDALLATFN
jgi:putative peptide modification system cyclase